MSAAAVGHGRFGHVVGDYGYVYPDSDWRTHALPTETHLATRWGPAVPVPVPVLSSGLQDAPVIFSPTRAPVLSVPSPQTPIFLDHEIEHSIDRPRMFAESGVSLHASALPSGGSCWNDKWFGPPSSGRSRRSSLHTTRTEPTSADRNIFSPASARSSPPRSHPEPVSPNGDSIARNGPPHRTVGEGRVLKHTLDLYAKPLPKAVKPIRSRSTPAAKPVQARLYDALPRRKGAPFLKKRIWDPGNVSEWHRAEIIKTSSPEQNDRVPRGVRPRPFINGYDITLSNKAYPEESSTVPEFHLQEDQPAGSARMPKITGRRKALLIGINYGGKVSTAGNDAHALHRLLARFHFKGPNVRLLTDEEQWVHPTKAAIIDGCRWLVKGAAPGDSLFFMFSGLGRGHRATAEVEPAIDTSYAPSDWEESGLLTDDVLYELLVRQLPLGCKLTCLIDAHSEAPGLDLPFSGDATGLVCRNPLDVIRGDVVAISGCKDAVTRDQRKAEPMSAMTAAFIHGLLHTNHYPPSIYELLGGIRHYLHSGISCGELPVISASKGYTLYQPFLL